MGQDYLIGRVDGETYSDLADEYQVSGYPTIKLLRADKQTGTTKSAAAEE